MSKEKLEQALEGLVKPTPPLATCRRCGQALKDPESVALGLGPICAVKEAMEDLEENESDQD
jgi:hypothetical protein